MRRELRHPGGRVVYKDEPRPENSSSWEGEMQSSWGQRASCGSDSLLFLFPQFCLSPDAGRGANAGLWCSPSPPSPSLRETVGGLWLSLPVHGLTPGPFPQHGSSSPQPGNPTSCCPPPEGLGEHKVGRGSDPGRKGPLPSTEM